MAHLLLADDRDVVLRLAGHHAIVAAHAGVQIDRHAPGVGFFFIGIGLVEREAGRGLFFFFFREVGILAVFLQRGFADQRTMAAIGRVHRLVALRRCELVCFAGLANLQAGCEPWRSARAQRIGIEALRSSDAAGALAAVAETSL